MADLDNSQFPVAVIGAGPVGLAAAAHLVRRGLPTITLEAGSSVAANLDSYRHVPLFSPWRYNIDGASRALLEGTAWREPDPDRLPTAGEIIDQYLMPLAQHPSIARGLHLDTRVTHITREGFDKLKTRGRESAPFVIRTVSASGERGQELQARAIIDATGTWTQPNPLGASGLPASGEAEAAAQIRYGMPDVLGRERERYAGKRVLVVGAGHSAVGTLVALAQLAERHPSTHIVWAIRGSDLARVIGGGDADGLPARGALGQRLLGLHRGGRLELHDNFRIREIRRTGATLSVISEARRGTASEIRDIDEIIGATGSRPDLSIAAELRLELDAWLESTERLAPLIDPNLHSCGTVRPHGHRELAHPEVGYYSVGAKSYGRAPNFLMATGYEQVRSVVAALAGDLASADDVRLELPETGVCSASFPPTGAEAVDTGCCGAAVPAESKVEAVDAGCCGGPAPVESNACCVADADARSAGGEGCGCGPPLHIPVKARTGCCA